MVTIIPIPAFADNYIWLLRDGARVAVVDPGDAAPVFAYLEREQVELTAILATHHHGDHVGGIPRLLEHYQVPVFGPARETIPGRTRALRDGDRIDVPGLPVTLRVLDIPGHTSGHIAYVGDIDGQSTLFCGDTLFAGGCGRLFEGTPAQMWASLSTLARLPPETQVFCGHEYTVANLRFAAAVEPGNADVAARQSREQAKRGRGEPTLPTTIATERATNPFLRAAVPGVRAAAQQYAAHALADDTAAFAALRNWKNEF